MKRILLALILFTPWLFIFPSCDDRNDCDYTVYCNEEIPDSGWVNVNVTLNSENSYVPIVLYQGNVEDNVIIQYDTMYLAQYSYHLPVSKKYAVEARYKDGSQTVIAVDGGRLSYNDFFNCDERCYEDEDLDLDLELFD